MKGLVSETKFACRLLFKEFECVVQYLVTTQTASSIVTTQLLRI